jgi:osmotically-inducible protein OsmY
MKIQGTLTVLSSLVLLAGCAHRAEYAAYDQNVPSPSYNGTTTYNNQSSTYNNSSTTSVAPQNNTSVGISQQNSASLTPNASDQSLVFQVRQALHNNPNLTEVVPNIQINASGGTVILTGSVPNEQQKQAVETLVKSTTGVVNVNNQLQVALSPTSSASKSSDQSNRIYSNAVSEAQSPTSTSSTPSATGNGSLTSSNRTDNLNSGLPPTSDRPDQEPRLYSTNDTGRATNPQTSISSEQSVRTADSTGASRTSGESKQWTAGAATIQSTPEQSSLNSTNNLNSAGQKDLKATANVGQTSQIYSNGPSASSTNLSGQASLYTSTTPPSGQAPSANAVGEATSENKALSATGNSQSRRYAEGQTNAAPSSATAASRDSFDVNIRGASQADQSLGQKLVTELRADTSLAAIVPAIRVNIDNGKATLRGTVKSQEEKLKIEAAVQKVTGITSVDDQLRISSTPGPTDRAPQ